MKHFFLLISGLQLFASSIAFGKADIYPGASYPGAKTTEYTAPAIYQEDSSIVITGRVTDEKRRRADRSEH